MNEKEPSFARCKSLVLGKPLDLINPTFNPLLSFGIGLVGVSGSY